ncbi:MAG: preprotein translocase subunit SecG [Candidatus Latescibacteria bacterium]|nr:preprotein translocase subunit SecG [Candidatus Latescibacterota bacterium]
METLLLIVHILVCLVLIVSILLQASKGGGLSTAFGGGGGGTAMFGGAGAATFLSKATTVLAVVFFLTCIGLWYASRDDSSAPETAAERALREQPVPLRSTPSGLPQPLDQAGQGSATERSAPAASSTDTVR